MTPKQAKRLRTSAGLTQAALADRMGVSQVTVARWETGVRPIAEAYARLMGFVCEQAQRRLTMSSQW